MSLYNDITCDYYCFYYNDSLKISIRFFGDYTFNTPSDWDSVKTTKLALQRINKINDFSLSESDILVSTRTVIEPYFSSIISLIPSSKIRFDHLKSFDSLGTDKQGHALYQNISPQDSFCLFQKLIKLNNYWLHVTGQTINSTDGSCYSSSLVDEYNKISNSIEYIKRSERAALKNPYLIADSLFNSDSNGNYIKPIDYLKSEKNVYENSSLRNSYVQCLETYKSFVGMTEPSLVPINVYFPNPTNSFEPFSSEFGGIVDTIISLTSNNKIIIFNESHIYPSQRLLLSGLLNKLYEAGFRKIALEAVWNDKEINAIGFPTLKSGFYTREPQMANLIRKAKEIGYQVISYEDPTLGNREYNQAVTLSREFRKDSTAKMIVLCGSYHILEKRSDSSRTWMAEHLKEISKIDPLTFNTVFFENVYFDNPRLLSLISGSKLNEIAPVGFNFVNDYYLFNVTSLKPFTCDNEKGNFAPYKPIQIVVPQLIKKVLLVQIFSSKEYGIRGRVPVASHYVDSENCQMTYWLPPDEYVVVYYGASGEIILVNKIILS